MLCFSDVTEKYPIKILNTWQYQIDHKYSANTWTQIFVQYPNAIRPQVENTYSLVICV